MVIAPAAVVLILLGLTTLPLWLAAAAALSPLLPGRWRPLRLLWIVVLYAVIELCALVAMFGLWIATGFGIRMREPWSMRAHYALVRWMLGALYRESGRVLGVQVRSEGPAPATYVDRPLIVLARHAGPGDSFLVVNSLMSGYGREPRIVLKDTLQWDPAIDVLLNRLPNRFISPEPGDRGGQVERHIAGLARDLDANDCLVIFPEGGNFTPARRDRMISRLQNLGLTWAAERAERMVHVLAPRPGGVVAALGSGVDADVVMVGHTGLEHLSSVIDLWRGLPMDTEIRMRWWHVPAADVPEDPDKIVTWLYGWWETIDTWIGQHKSAPVTDPAAD